MDNLPPPVSLDDVPLPPLPDQPYSTATARTTDDSTRKSTTRRKGKGSKTPEKDDSSAESAPEAAGSTGIKRPLNRFFLYKVWAQPHYVKAYPGLSNQVISKMISRDWHNRSDQVKEHFAQLAVWEKARHAQQYPNYKYQPKTNRSGKRKFETREERPTYPENAKPPIQTTISNSAFNNVEQCAYAMGHPSQFDNYPLPLQYDAYGYSSNDRSQYTGLPEMIPHSTIGVDQCVQRLDMVSGLRAQTTDPLKAQPGLQPFHPIGWSESSGGSNGAHPGNRHSWASSIDSFELHQQRMPLNSPFPPPSFDANIPTTYQDFLEFHCETVPPALLRADNGNCSASSGSEQPDSSEISDACLGDIEDDDNGTTVYDDEIESLQMRLLELRRLKLKKIQQEARRPNGDHRRSSSSSGCSSMSESDRRRRDNVSKQEMIVKLDNMFYPPPLEKHESTYEKATAPLSLAGSHSPYMAGSHSPYTREHPYSTTLNADRYSSNAAVSSESSYFYESLPPLSNTIPVYLSDTISAEDTTGYLRQLLDDEPADHPAFRQQDTSAQAGSCSPMHGNLSGAIALLQNAEREAITDSEEDDTRS